MPKWAYWLLLLLLASAAVLTVPLALLAQAFAGWGLNQLAWSAGVALLSQVVPQHRRGRPFVALIAYLVLFTILASVHM